MNRSTYPRSSKPEAPAVLTVGNTGRCNCPRPDTCVLRLQLPPLQCAFRDGFGQMWTVLSRDQLADPSTGRVNSTRILIRRFEVTGDGTETIFKTIRCAGPEPFENPYERNRPGRPPRAQRLPFEPATPPDHRPVRAV